MYVRNMSNVHSFNFKYLQVVQLDLCFQFDQVVLVDQVGPHFPLLLDCLQFLEFQVVLANHQIPWDQEILGHPSRLVPLEGQVGHHLQL